MNQAILRAFLVEDCDEHVRGVLLREIDAWQGPCERIREFTFNRFNVRLDFSTGMVALDDELNPGPEGEWMGRLNEFREHLATLP